MLWGQLTPQVKAYIPPLLALLFKNIKTFFCCCINDWFICTRNIKFNKVHSRVVSLLDFKTYAKNRIEQAEAIIEQAKRKSNKQAKSEKPHQFLICFDRRLGD